MVQMRFEPYFLLGIGVASQRLHDIVDAACPQRGGRQGRWCCYCRGCPVDCGRGEERQICLPVGEESGQERRVEGIRHGYFAFPIRPRRFDLL